MTSPGSIAEHDQDYWKARALTAEGELEQLLRERGTPPDAEGEGRGFHVTVAGGQA